MSDRPIPSLRGIESAIGLRSGAVGRRGARPAGPRLGTRVSALTGALATLVLLAGLSTQASADEGPVVPVGGLGLGSGAMAAATVGHTPKPPKKPKKPKPPPAPPNPLAGRPMGTYKGPADQAWAPYTRAGGSTKSLLAKIALTPKAKWFGAWVSDGAIEGSVRDYVRNATGGNPDVLVQMAVFRMQPWEHDACRRLPSGGEQASYRRWIDGFARGIGNAHTALILQPDGPFALCVPHRSTIPSRLIAYAAQKFSALPNTSVYIDGGAADWPPGNPRAAADFLVADGVKYARGIALNSTHYSSTSDEIRRGAAIVQDLAGRGITDKHVVINTSSNGKPFVFGDAPGRDPDNATVCGSRSSSHCVTLGIPPTTDVGNPRWGLGANERALAAQYVDAYLWFGRPWLYRQNDPFDMGRALQLVRTTPY